MHFRYWLCLIMMLALTGCSSMLLGGSPGTAPPTDCDPDRDRNCRTAVEPQQVESEVQGMPALKVHGRAP